MGIADFQNCHSPYDVATQRPVSASLKFYWSLDFLGASCVRNKRRLRYFFQKLRYPCRLAMIESVEGFNIGRKRRALSSACIFFHGELFDIQVEGPSNNHGDPQLE